MPRVHPHDPEFTPAPRRGRSRAQRREGAKDLAKKLAWLDGWPVFRDEEIVWMQEQVPWEPVQENEGWGLYFLQEELSRRNFQAIRLQDTPLSPSRLSAAQRHLHSLERYPVALGYLEDQPEAWKRHRRWQLEWAKSVQRLRIRDLPEQSAAALAGDRQALDSIVRALAMEAGCVGRLEPSPSSTLRKLGRPAVEPLRNLLADPAVSTAGRLLAFCLLRLIVSPGRPDLPPEADPLQQRLSRCTPPGIHSQGLPLIVQAAILGADVRALNRLTRALGRCGDLPVVACVSGPHLFATGDLPSTLRLTRALADAAPLLHAATESQALYGDGMDLLLRYMRELYVRAGAEAIALTAEFTRCQCPSLFPAWTPVSGSSLPKQARQWRKLLARERMDPAEACLRAGAPYAPIQRQHLFSSLGTGLSLLSGKARTLAYLNHLAEDAPVPFAQTTFARDADLPEIFACTRKKFTVVENRALDRAVILAGGSPALLEKATSLRVCHSTAELCVRHRPGVSSFLSVVDALQRHTMPWKITQHSLRYFERTLCQLFAAPLRPADQSRLADAIGALLAHSVDRIAGLPDRVQTRKKILKRLIYLFDDVLGDLAEYGPCRKVLHRYPRAVVRLIRISATRDLFLPQAVEMYGRSLGPPLESYPEYLLWAMEALSAELGGKSGRFLDTLLDQLETASDPPVSVHYRYFPIFANLADRDPGSFGKLLPELFTRFRPDRRLGSGLEHALAGTRKLRRFPEIRTFAAGYLLDYPGKSLALLRWLGLAARFNDSHLDEQLRRFDRPERSTPLPDDLRQLATVIPERENLLLDWVHFASMAGEHPALTGQMRKRLDAPARMRAELDHLRTRHRARPSPSIARRMANLERYLANGAQLSPKERRNLVETVERRVAELQFAALRRLVGDFYLKYLERITGQRAAPVEMNDHLVNAVQLYYDIDSNRRHLKTLLVHHLRGETAWTRILPENARFLQDLSGAGIDPEAWLSPFSATFPLAHGKRQKVRLYIETDPIRVLQMGNYFDTCLSLGDFNSFSTVANAVDLNKRVVYAEDDSGWIVGRKLIGLNENFELVGFATYASLETGKVNAALRLCFTEFLQTFARRCGLSLGSGGKIPELACDSWYDDGICPWEEE